MEYRRNFIILNKEDEEFCKQGATGYCKIESAKERSKIKVFVQGLKQSDGQTYKVLLIFYNENGCIWADLGDISIIKNSGELDIEVNSQKVLSTQIPITKFNIIAVCTKGINDVNYQFPLVGYHNIYKQDNWKAIFTEKTLKTNYAEDSSKESTDDTKKESFEYKESQKEYQYSKHIDSSIYMKYLKQGNFEKFNEAMEGLKAVHQSSPFVKAKLKYRWWEVSDLNFFDNILRYSTTSNQIFKHPLIKRLIKNTNHCLFGVVIDTDNRARYIALGFPSRYNVKEQIFMGGFSNFYPVLESNKKNGSYGYWVVHIRLDNDSIAMKV